MMDMKDRVNRMAGIGTALVSLFAGVGAVVVSSCCVVPLALSLAGLSGAWLGELPGLIAYRNIFLTVAALALAAAWVVALWRRAECLPNDACGRSSRGWITFGVLGLSTFLVSAAAGWAWIEPTVMSALLRLNASA